MGRMRDGEYMYSNLSLKHAKKFIVYNCKMS